MNIRLPWISTYSAFHEVATKQGATDRALNLQTAGAARSQYHGLLHGLGFILYLQRSLKHLVSDFFEVSAEFTEC